MSGMIERWMLPWWKKNHS